MSFLTQSHQVFFGRPLCLIPSTSHVIQCLTQSLSYFRSTCPNHLNLLFLIIKLTGSNPKSSQSSSLFFLSFSLTPQLHQTCININGRTWLGCRGNQLHWMHLYTQLHPLLDHNLGQNLGWSESTVWLDRWCKWNQSQIGIYSRKRLFYWM